MVNVNLHLQVLRYKTFVVELTRELMSYLFQCQCQQGYEGRTCDQKQKPCAANPCEGRGECFDKNGSFFCRFVLKIFFF